ncbi:B-cell receptor CD22-like isoform X1 [Poecilia latipinna]|uniref:B-cell receptor CD22-like isoform X1 n=1 Tax=Poecilia latipinna TaxID=48699 RepID=UPI00072E1BD1|nr:PREDICTED: B-cell receptor CD22-like isoform X1 [Poecilia latipinna]XP_014875302.1 PREDICTED: B-cell receptor CD22-like isoform X1 [Poecilia latipinna]
MEAFKRVMAALTEKVLTVSMLLSVFFLPGVQTGCSQNASLGITAPETLEGLSGSCLFIPCSFLEIPREMSDGGRQKFEVSLQSHPDFGQDSQNVTYNSSHPEDDREMNMTGNVEKFDDRRETIGVWITDEHGVESFPQNVIYNSSQSQNRYTVNIIGNLSEKNCTTLFSSRQPIQATKFYFRMESGLFRATAVCDPVQVTVRDSAWSPRIEISGVVKEKNSVTVTCSALTPCPYSPPGLTLNLQPNPHRQMQKNKDGTFTTTIQQNITLSEIHDGYNIICFARYPMDGGKHKTANAEVTLSVSYAPKNTSASISLTAGRWVELNCSSRAKPPVSGFTWFENTTSGAMKVGEGENYGLNATEEGIYYCVATNDVGSQTSPEIRLMDPVIAYQPADEIAERKGIDVHQIQTTLFSGAGFFVLVCLLKIIMWFYKIKRKTPQQANTPVTDQLGLDLWASTTEGAV